MNQVQSVNSTQQVPSKEEADMQASKRFEKMQAHCSSHRTAGTLEAPASLSAAGVLWKVESEGEHR